MLHAIHPGSLILRNSFNRLVQDLQSGLDLIFRNSQSGDESKTSISGRDDQCSPFARSGDQVRGLGDVSFRELETEDQTAAADSGDDFGVFLLESLEASCEERRFGLDGFLELRGRETFDDVVGDAAGERVSAERGAMVAGFDVLADGLLGDDGSADGEAVAQSLCGGEDIGMSGLAGGGDQGGVAVSPEAACTGETALDFVEDQNGAGGITAFAESEEELWCCGVDTSFSLDGLDDDTARLVCDQGVELFDVVESTILESGNHRRKWSLVLGVRGGRESSHGTSVEGVMEGDELMLRSRRV